MPARRTPSVLTALQSALRAQPAGAQDAATVALAKRYALELDDADVISTAATKALRQLAKADVEDDLFEKFEALAARIEQVHVAATIGPKLLAALEQLGLTPKARNAILATPGGGGGNDGGPSPLGHLRALGSNRAPAVDSSAS
ncbi:MAG: hypothetical protein EPO65_00685 [Dehalococcoidia bacterium]|nr:MAG: hypothetical protein EPO65_00685 [Dehalococcoidia bacterium]